MSTTYRERILDYLWSVSPNQTTNSQIQQGTGIRSHQQVYLLTQELLNAGRIKGEQRPGGWVFGADESPAIQLASPGPALRTTGKKAISPQAFEELAQEIMGQHFGMPLAPGRVGDVQKLFDLVSVDKHIVGDAKYFTLVGGERLPPAKFSVIAEHVWLLEKTGAPALFLVFGHDRQVPELWLKRYGKLAGRVAFFFIEDNGALQVLK
jgi:hypothetical protein